MQYKLPQGFDQSPRKAGKLLFPQILKQVAGLPACTQESWDAALCLELESPLSNV